MHQNGYDYRFHFDTANEALRFIKFIRGERESKTKSPTHIEKEPEPEIQLFGWKECFTIEKDHKEGIKKIIGLSSNEFFYLKTESEDFDTQTTRWKAGIKWYNQVSSKLSNEVSKVAADQFKEDFSRSLYSFFLESWNSNFDKFNVRESAKFHSIVRNIYDATPLFTQSSLDTEVRLLLQAMEASMIAFVVANGTEQIQNILANFWSRENFYLEGEMLISQSAIDVLQLVSTVKEATECMQAASQERVLHRICQQ